MHFREVNKKLNQLKANVYWAKQNLNGVDWYDVTYDYLVRDYHMALDALNKFQNTTLAQLSIKGV